jgi:hypothetical protein
LGGGNEGKNGRLIHVDELAFHVGMEADARIEGRKENQRNTRTLNLYSRWIARALKPGRCLRSERRHQ